MDMLRGRVVGLKKDHVDYGLRGHNWVISAPY